jgi:hypothetical protein
VESVSQRERIEIVDSDKREKIEMVGNPHSSAFKAYTNDDVDISTDKKTHISGKGSLSSYHQPQVLKINQLTEEEI